MRTRFRRGGTRLCSVGSASSATVTFVHAAGSAAGSEVIAIKLADRLGQLGTETAFAVARSAADLAATGVRVFPFHLGDLNLPTPDNIVHAMHRAVADGRTGYCPSAGIPALREALARDVGERRGIDFGPEDVLVQSGGKPVITKFIQAVMDPGDEVLYPNPGFPIYESQIEYFGGVAVPYRFVPGGTGFAIDLDHLRGQVGPRTRAIIYNDLHNPTGAESTDAEREQVARLALEHDLWVLSDEAYFDVRYSGTSRSIAALPGLKERTVILYTYSKKFAMTGWRLGAAIVPEPLSEVIATMNTNDESCTTNFIQHAGVEALTGDQAPFRAMLEVLRDRRDTAAAILRDTPGITLTVPETTFYLYADVTDAMAAMGIVDLASFAHRALHATGVSFCTREHFGRSQPGEQRHHVRFAYSGIDSPDIREGLELLRGWMAAA